MVVEAVPSVVEWAGEMPCLHSGLGQAQPSKGLVPFLHQSILTSERVTALQNSPRSWGVKSGSAREIHSHYTPLPPLFLANFNWPPKDQLGHRFSQVIPNWSGCSSIVFGRCYYPFDKAFSYYMVVQLPPPPYQIYCLLAQTTFHSVLFRLNIS